MHLNVKYIKALWKETKVYAALVFAIATAVVTFIPVDSILEKMNCNNFGSKIIFFILLCVFSVALAIGKLSFKQEIVLYEKETAKIKIKYGDMQKIMTSNETMNPYIVVVPINNNINVVANFELISKYGTGTMHYYWVKQMLELGYTEEKIKSMVEKEIKVKQSGFCNVGSTCFIRAKNNINYLLLVTTEIEDIQGKPKSTYTDQQYFMTLQRMIEILSPLCFPGETVYVPIIGGGAARKNQSRQDLLRIMSEVFMYNDHSLNYDVEIIIYDKLKDQIPLYSISQYN